MTATEIEQRQIENDKRFAKTIAPHVNHIIHEAYHRSLRDIIAAQYSAGKSVGFWGWVETDRYGGGDDCS